MEENVAIYLDFENLAISAEQTYPTKEKPLSLGPIVDYAASRGNICIKKSYSDWSKPIFARYQGELNEYGFEMIHLPATSAQGKNGSDLRLTIDILEDMQQFPIINTFIIGSGDTDFIPLVRKIRARGKKIIVIGFENSVGSLVKNNTEFKSINELFGELSDFKGLEDSSSSEISEKDLELERASAKDLIVRYIKNSTTDDPILLSKLKINLLRLQPSFSEKKLGYSSFKTFLESLRNDVVEKIENDSITGHPKVYFKDITSVPTLKIDREQEIQQFLNTTLAYNKDRKTRHELAKYLLKLFREHPAISMHDMIEYLSNNIKTVSKTSIKKYIFALGQGRVFSYAERVYGGSLFSRPQKLNETITNTEAIDIIYQKRVSELLSNQFSDLSELKINSLLNEK